MISFTTVTIHFNVTPSIWYQFPKSNAMLHQKITFPFQNPHLQLRISCLSACLFDYLFMYLLFSPQCQLFWFWEEMIWTLTSGNDFYMIKRNIIINWQQVEQKHWGENLSVKKWQEVIQNRQTMSKEPAGMLEDKMLLKFTFPQLTSTEMPVLSNKPSHLSALNVGLLKAK